MTDLVDLRFPRRNPRHARANPRFTIPGVRDRGGVSRRSRCVPGCVSYSRLAHPGLVREATDFSTDDAHRLERALQRRGCASSSDLASSIDHGPPPDRRSPNACPPQSSQYSSPRHGSPMRVATRPTRGPAGGRTTGVTPRPRGSSRFDRNARPDSALRRFMPQLGLAFLPPLASPISRDQRRNQPDPEPARPRRPPHRPPHHRPSAPRNRATPRTARIRPIASNRLNTARNRHVTRGIHRGGRFTARVRLTS